ncbi:unnamed protein product [Rangifer tarandus platyrhynchus]|uniref:Uncharacterized protein n=2 Tax=Rangifer tarandus platyrhynchus TaxID=3082113 RepID=A0ACB1KDR0_RANTA
MQPQGESPRPCQAMDTKRSSRPSAGLGKSSQETQKMASWYLARIPTGKLLSQDVKQSMRRFLKVLCMTSANPPVKVPSAKPELERELSPGWKHPEEILGVFINRKSQQIHECWIPVNVYCSRFSANHFIDLPGQSNAPMGTENAGCSQDWEASM